MKKEIKISNVVINFQSENKWSHKINFFSGLKNLAALAAKNFFGALSVALIDI